MNGRVPAGHFFVNWFAIRQLIRVTRRNIQPFAVQLVSSTNADGIDLVESVQIGDGDLVDAVDHASVTSRDGVEPAASALASRSGAKFASEAVKHLRQLRVL